MEIRSERHGAHVVLVTIDNPPRLNAMTRAMLADLAKLWDELEASDCRCIVLTGAGTRAFSAGADISGDLSASAETARVVSHALLAWYREGKLKPCISHRLPLENTVEAIGLLTSRRAHGKVVVLPGAR